MSEQLKEELCYFCNKEPGGKFGICEKCQTERFQIYDIKPGELGKVDFTLSYIHRQLIRYMGERNGETFYEYSKVQRTDDESLREEYRKYGEPLTDHIKRLIKMGFVRETLIIGQTRVLLRLTEWGFKVYEQVKNQLEVVGINTLPPKA